MDKVYNFSYKKYIPLLALTLLLFISIGYAYLSSTLNIYGTSGISAASWNVYFDNLNNQDGVTPVSEPVINTDKDQVSFEVNLDKPGDYYEFTVDTVNDGSIDAMIDTITKTELSESDSKYLYYDLNYSNGKKVRKYDFLNAGESKTIKVKVGYKSTDLLTVEDLDEDGTTLNLSFTVNYVQKEDVELPEYTLAASNNLGFRNSSYLNKIKTITFNDEINVPLNAVQSWDVSADGDNTVQAYFLTNKEDNTMYDLYIEADGEIYANQNSEKLFYNMTKLEEINNMEYFNTSKVSSMRSMFSYCQALTTLDVSNFDTSNVTKMNIMFSSCQSLTTLDVSHFDTSKVTNMEYMFFECQSLTELDVSNFDTSKVTDILCMFYSCQSLTTLDVSHFDTSKVTNMEYMFFECQSLTELDVSNFDTSNVTDMYRMFRECQSLTTLDVSNFDTSKVTTMEDMFYFCESLTTLDVSNFNTSNVTDMSAMFFYCHALTTLDVSNFDTSNVTKMHSMFQSCLALTTLDVSNFDTSKVTNMISMFGFCQALTTLDVSNFDTSKVTHMETMFYSCQSLTTLDVSDFDTSNATYMYDMFSGVTCQIIIPQTSGTLTNTTTTFYGKDSTVSVTGTFTLHTHVNGVITTNPTCTEDGSVVYNCPNHTVTQVIPKLGHDYQNDVCTRCGKVKPPETIIETSSHTDYGDNNNYIVLGTWDYSSFESTVDIEITYQTESTSFDWLSITSGTDYIAGTSYSATRDYLKSDGTIVSATGTTSSIKFGGNTKTTLNFTDVAMPTGSVIFRSDSSQSSYYGVRVVVTPHTD